MSILQTFDFILCFNKTTLTRRGAHSCEHADMWVRACGLLAAVGWGTALPARGAPRHDPVRHARERWISRVTRSAAAAAHSQPCGGCGTAAGSSGSGLAGPSAGAAVHPAQSRPVAGRTHRAAAAGRALRCWCARSTAHAVQTTVAARTPHRRRVCARHSTRWFLC